MSSMTDPAILAEPAQGRLRQKLPALREALEGRFGDLHALPIGAILAHLDFLDARIDRLSDAIEERIAPFEPAVRPPCSIPDVQQRTAEVIVAEIGPDMTVFPSARHPASWAGQCPGNDRSAAKQRSGRTRKGSRRLNAALEDAAMAAVHPQQPPARALRTPPLPHRPRQGARRLKHSIPVAAWHMLTTGELYSDLGADYYRGRDPAATTKRLVAQLERLGHTVTLQEAAA